MRNKQVIAYLVVITLLIITSLVAITVGGSTIGATEIIDLLTNSEDVSNTSKIIIFEIRIPRIIGAITVGATLAVSGTLIKAVMKNPLADTGLLGIQSGASLCAMIVILIAPQFMPMLPLFAFGGGISAYLMLSVLAYKDGIQPLRLVLAGVAVNSLFGAFIGIITIYNSEELQNALTWLNGSLASITVTDAKILVIYGTIALIIAMFTIPKCNLLALDDMTIINLGENLTRTRMILASVSVLLSAISVSIVGVIGFVGLIIPHIARMIIGTNHKYMMPFSMILGSLFVLLADTMQVIVFSPVEMPVGIIISLIGAPFFLYLLRKEKI
ncbi:iron ABC transporter permease [Mollicutes bacterium LVI A0039]|nr:iron ABC transporter permease [Mollicutes bacterium LVI A0039]